MANDLLNRAMRTTELVLLFPLAIGLLTLHWYLPAAIAAGGGWCLLNLFLLQRLAPMILGQEKQKAGSCILLLVVKFPVLYFVGWIVLSQSGFSTLGLMIGFSLPFSILTLYALVERGRDLFPLQFSRR